jgi:hypothetical protein
MLDTLQAGLQIQTPDDEVRGTLQIAVPSDLGRNLLLNVFRAFRQRHPALRCAFSFPTIGPTCLKIRSTSRFATTTTPRLFPAGGAGKPSGAGGFSAVDCPARRAADAGGAGQHNALMYVLRGRQFDRWT